MKVIDPAAPVMSLAVPGAGGDARAFVHAAPFRPGRSWWQERGGRSWSPPGTTPGSGALRYGPYGKGRDPQSQVAQPASLLNGSPARAASQEVVDQHHRHGTEAGGHRRQEKAQAQPTGALHLTACCSDRDLIRAMRLLMMIG